MFCGVVGKFEQVRGARDRVGVAPDGGPHPARNRLVSHPQELSVSASNARRALPGVRRLALDES